MSARGPRAAPAARLAAAAGIVAWSALPSVLIAQEGAAGSGAVGPGDRVEVRAPSLVHRRVEGRLRSVSGDTLLIAGDDGRIRARVRLGDVERLRVQRGSGDARWRGAFLGAPAGFVLGVAVDEETRDDVEAVRHELRIGGLVGGAVLGWLVGRAIEVRRWVEVRPGAVGRGGAGVGVRLGVP